jgi:two-component system response regulator RegX3
MVAMPPLRRHPRAVPTAPFPGPERVAWLVLAADGPALHLPGLVDDTAIRVVGDPRRFRDILLAERPRVVVVCQPPADDETIELVSAERRRRSALRALHLATPEAVGLRLAALARGFDDAFTTAVTASELAGRIGWLEARARDRLAHRTTLPVADGLELDLAAHELRSGNAPIHLRPKEFGLLALLAAHPGRAYTRRELLERVWGSGTGSGARTVDVHIRWLRSKVEPDPDRPVHLITVRGVGYRFDAPRR